MTTIDHHSGVSLRDSRPDDSREAAGAIHSLETFAADFSVPSKGLPRMESFGPRRPSLSLDRAVVRLSVSRDEEYVRLQLVHEGFVLDLGERTHNFLLLTLARHRVADAASGLPETSCGWRHVEDLNYEANMGCEKLNLDVFRLRGQLVTRGVVGGDRIIERRRSSRQLRVGSGRLVIESL